MPVAVLIRKGDMAACLLKFWWKLNLKVDMATSLLTFWTKMAISPQACSSFARNLVQRRYRRRPIAILKHNHDIAASLFTFCSQFNQNGDIAAGLLTFWNKMAISPQTCSSFENLIKMAISPQAYWHFETKWRYRRKPVQILFEI